jgi:tetratricopeptide (TPR) repeat protein
MGPFPPEPPFRGTLAEEPLARLLAAVPVSGAWANGTLELRSPDGMIAQLVLASGRLAKLRVPLPTLYLSSIAYELGLLTSDALNASLLEVARTKKLHGATLLERGELTREQLAQCLGAQMVRKLHTLFALPERSTFAFLPELDALSGWGGHDWPERELYPSVWHGVRAYPPSKHVDVGTRGARGQRFRVAPGADTSGFGLAAEEASLVDCLRARPLELEELAQLGGWTVKQASALLYFLRLTGAVEIAPAAVAVASSLPPPLLSSRPPPATSGLMTKVVRPSRPHDPVAAARLSAKAYAALLAGNFLTAQKLCDEAHQADPQEIEHRALCVWLAALLPDGMTDNGTRQAISVLSRLIETHDESANARFFRGQLYKRLGHSTEAARDFRAALDLDPKRHDALAELRLYIARRKRRT